MKRYLGPDYIIDASMGHVRDLPVKTLGVDIRRKFTPTYEISKGKKKVIAALKKKAKAADVVYLAPDPDREGEAIAWHLKEALELPDAKVKRVTFEEFTKSAITRAFEHPGELRMDLVNAQQARRILDRIVGYKISPLLWKRIQPGLSAGRVQSVAVRLVVDREREIRAFDARPQSDKEYWTVKAVLSRRDRPDETFEAELKLDDKKELKTEGQAAGVVARLREADYVVTDLDVKDQTVRPYPPFSTDLLLRAASVQLRFSAKKTMMVAQQLYEGIEVGSRGAAGLITYMRTDSYSLSREAIGAARSFITDTFGGEYVPEEANVYRAARGAQEAHEAIRPSDVTLTPEQAGQYLNRDQARLYELIWKRFVACQMNPAEYRNTVVSISADDRVFQTRGKQTLFDGFTRVLPRGKDDKDQLLPELAVGNDLQLHDLDPEQHFEQPPPRYTEATLIQELKKQGIGRPSTYSPIISTVQARQYVELKQRRFHATALGETVTDALVQHFPDILDLKFTSQMEESLDDIAEAKKDWIKVLSDFYGPFAKALKEASNTVEESEYTCPECGKPLVYKFSRAKRFLGCSGYPKCRFSAPVDREGKITEREEPEMTEFKCPDCDAPMVIREGRYGKFFACSAYPKCKKTMNIGEDGKPVEKARGGGEPTDRKCPKCGSPMVKKVSRRGPFLACSAYPKCKTTENLPKDPGKEKTDAKEPPTETVEQKCPECGSPMVRRTSRRGPFLGCSAYPKCRTIMDLPGEAAPAEKKPPPETTDVDCPECGKKMVIREGRYGKFLACTGYPKCKTTRKLDEDGQPAS